MPNFSKESWLNLAPSAKSIAWNHQSTVTIDNMPLDEALSNDIDLLNDTVNWLSEAAINELLRQAPEEFFWDSRFSITNTIIRRRRRPVAPEQANITRASLPSNMGFFISDSLGEERQEITVTPENERRTEEEMVSMRDLSLYYNGTINYADGKLCKIIGHTEKGMICRPVNGGKSFVTKDLKPFNNVVTGLVNTPTGCVSCFRKPTRTAKEGINTESMDIGMGIAPWDNYPEEFMDMINDKYPSKEEAIEIAKRDGINVAISKFKYYDFSRNRFINVLNKYGKQERKRYELD